MKNTFKDTMGWFLFVWCLVFCLNQFFQTNHNISYLMVIAVIIICGISLGEHSAFDMLEVN